MSDAADGDDTGGARAFFLYTGQDASEIPRGVTLVRVDRSVRAIREAAFADCDRLAQVELPEGLEVIGRGAFASCRNLAGVEIPSSVHLIDGKAFWRCDRLETVELREGRGQIIGGGAFGFCGSLKRVKIPSSVKLIGDGAFCQCHQLAEVELCEGRERIEHNAVCACSSLKPISIPSSVIVVGAMAFEKCSRLVEVELCEGLQYIGESAFRYCNCLKCIKIPPSVKIISAEAFQDCHQLVEVELHEGLERIGHSAFCNCVSLKFIDIPSSVRLVDFMAFERCSQLAEFGLHEGLEHIGDHAFSYCKFLSRIKIPSSVKVIDKRAFFCCSQLEMVELCEGLEKIGEAAFDRCTSIKCIKVPSSVKLIDKHAFRRCWKLMGVEISDEIHEIDETAFEDCFSLRNVVIPRGVRLSQCFGTSLGNMVIQRGMLLLQGFGTGCHDLLKVFDSKQVIGNALKSRFDGLPMHKLCYNQSHYPTNAPEQLKDNIIKGASMPSLVGRSQDCLGMTPLHILACSTSPCHPDLYQFIITNQPGSLTTEDKWGCLPILYAIWRCAPQEIVKLLITSQISAFPDFILNWDRMIETICRSGLSLEAVRMLLEIRQKFFPGQSIDWPKAARQLTISCLFSRNSGGAGFGDFFSTWTSMLEFIKASPSHHGLVQSLMAIRQSLFPGQYNTNWKMVCEHFVEPLKGWWHPGYSAANLSLFHFLVKCNIPDRLNAVGIRKWRKDIQKMVENISVTDFDAVHAKLISCECEYLRLKDAAFFIELALWKSKISQSSRTGERGADAKKQCRVNCGANVIIPNILPFVIGN